MHHDLGILLTLCVSLSTALVFGYCTHRLKLSPIVGYLLAGVAIGPQTPGFIGDQDSAAQLAEIGVILLMFGVGLHFRLEDLLAVRKVAVPGAIGQVAVATLCGAIVLALGGWGWTNGVVIGMAISVASTVVLARVLTDNDLVDTVEGHVAVGWLIVEDLFTVLALVMLPALAPLLLGTGGDPIDMLSSLGKAIFSIVALSVIVLWGGRWVIPRILTHVARTRTRELFTLTILALALTIATGSAEIFGVSMALGAFLAGMVVGQSQVSHQAAADALPMQDAFAVLFFVSVGMLFDPHVILAYPGLFLALLAVILCAKPLAAALIVWGLGYSVRTALTVSIGLAQIGEFSFILANLARQQSLITDDEMSLLVACAIVSIALNPLLFRRLVHPLEAWLRRRTTLWHALTRRAEARVRGSLPTPAQVDESSDRSRAIVVGYGPVGRTASELLKDFGIQPVVIDLNVDVVGQLLAAGESAVYGDAARRDILSAAGIANADYLLVTTPDLETRTVVIIVARELNPGLKVLVRARYLAERAWLEEVGATAVCYEEAEAAIGLATLVLKEVGADDDRIEWEQRRIRMRLAFQTRPEEDNST